MTWITQVHNGIYTFDHSYETRGFVLRSGQRQPLRQPGGPARLEYRLYP